MCGLRKRREEDGPVVFEGLLVAYAKRLGWWGNDPCAAHAVGSVLLPEDGNTNTRQGRWGAVGYGGVHFLKGSLVMSQMPPSMPQAGEPMDSGSGSAYGVRAKVSGMAVTSMILGILAIPLGCVLVGIVLGLVALILGIVSLWAINREPQRLGGKGYAITGIVTGALGMVVIGPALAIAILLPSLGKAKEMTNRTICGTNLKGQGTAFALYAASYGDKLPNLAGGPNLNDLGADNLSALMGVGGVAGISPKIFSCPSSGSASGMSGTAMPYVYFIDRPGLDPAVRTFLTPAGASNRASGMLPPLVLHKKMGEKDASQTELVVDEIISASNPPGASGFAAVSGQETNHMNGSVRPAGQNVLHLDSHVSWQSWSGARETGIKQGAGYYLWVIDP